MKNVIQNIPTFLFSTSIRKMKNLSENDITAASRRQKKLVLIS